MRPVEKKYRHIISKLRRDRRVNPKLKKLEEDISYKIQEIESYGFKFFPNHYIMDQVNELGDMVDDLIASNATQNAI